MAWLDGYGKHQARKEASAHKRSAYNRAAISDQFEGMMPADKHIRIRASEEFIRALEDWRRKQTPIPNQSEAIRALVVSALKRKPA